MRFEEGVVERIAMREEGIADLSRGKPRTRQAIRLSALGVILLACAILTSTLCENAFALTWEEENEISIDQMTNENQWSPKIVSDGFRTYGIWEHDQDGDWDLYFGYSPWTSLMSVGGSGIHQCAPSIAMSGMHAHIVWQDWGVYDTDIYYAHYSGISQPTIERLSEDLGATDQANPEVAVLSSQVYVVWEDLGDGHDDIHFKYYDGSDWGPVQEVAGGDWNQSRPSIAASNGRVHLAWEDYEDGDSDIYYSSFDGSAWELPLEITNDLGSENQLLPSIAADGDTVHFVWEDHGDGDPDIYYRYFDGTYWQPVEEISKDSGNEVQAHPSIAAADGKVAIVWEDYADGDPDIFYRYFDGSDWGHIREISTDTEDEEQRLPSVAVENENVHVVWADREDGDYDIYYRTGTEEGTTDQGAGIELADFWWMIVIVVLIIVLVAFTVKRRGIRQPRREPGWAETVPGQGRVIVEADVKKIIDAQETVADKTLVYLGLIGANKRLEPTDDAQYGVTATGIAEAIDYPVKNLYRVLRGLKEESMIESCKCHIKDQTQRAEAYYLVSGGWKRFVNLRDESEEI